MAKGPITPDGVRVCARQCSTCVFRPGNLMHLRPGRLQEMVEGSLKGDSFIACHKTLDGDRAVCRGFYDRYAKATIGLRLADPGLLGLLEVDPDTGE